MCDLTPDETWRMNLDLALIGLCNRMIEERWSRKETLHELEAVQRAFWPKKDPDASE